MPLVSLMMLLDFLIRNHEQGPCLIFTAPHTNVMPHLLVFPPEMKISCCCNRRCRRFHQYFRSIHLLHLPRLDLNGLPTIVIILGVLLARLAEHHVQDGIVGNLVIGQSCRIGQRLGSLLGVGGVDPHLCGRHRGGRRGGGGGGRGVVAAAR